MKSPFTGGEVTRKSKIVTLTFRKEKFEVERYYYICNDTGRTFSNAEVDDIAFNNVYDQYRKRHGIPSPEMLKNLRLRYGLSAHDMSKIVGTGINQYGLYENGEMPTIIIGQALAKLFDKKELLKSIDNAQSRLGKKYLEIREKVENYTEPISLPLKKESYKDFMETTITKPLQEDIEKLKKARWTTCSCAYVLA